MRKTKQKSKTKKTAKQLIMQKNKTGKNIWKTLAKKMLVPRRKRKKINLSRLERLAKKLGEKKTFVVPGKVLGTGKTTLSLKIAALDFSETARKKINESNGKTIPLAELVNTKQKEKDLIIIT